MIHTPFKKYQISEIAAVPQLTFYACRQQHGIQTMKLADFMFLISTEGFSQQCQSQAAQYS